MQSGVPQHTTHKGGHLLWRHLKTDNTILPVADLTPIKTTIPREEGRPTQGMQKWEDFLILEPLAGNVDADLPHRNPPTPQVLPLTGDDIFVQDVHDTVEATTNSSACFRSACVARCTASAIASCVILPCHSSIIVTACNRNGPGLQSARFQAHIKCLYPSPPAHMSWPLSLQSSAPACNASR